MTNDMPAHETDAEEREIEITPEMIAAGSDVILGETGGADLGSHFSPADLARRVYSAMEKDRRRMLEIASDISRSRNNRTCGPPRPSSGA